MEKRFAALKSSHVLIALWTAMSCLFVISGSSGVAQKFAALAGYVVAFVLYPAALVIASQTLGSSRTQRFVFALSALGFVAAFVIRPFDETPLDVALSGAGMLALLAIQFVAAAVLVGAEHRYRIPGSSLTAWFSLSFLLFGGIAFVHGRYQRAIAVARAG